MLCLVSCDPLPLTSPLRVVTLQLLLLLLHWPLCTATLGGSLPWTHSEGEEEVWSSVISIVLCHKTCTYSQAVCTHWFLSSLQTLSCCDDICQLWRRRVLVLQLQHLEWRHSGRPCVPVVCLDNGRVSSLLFQKEEERDRGPTALPDLQKDADSLCYWTVPQHFIRSVRPSAGAWFVLTDCHVESLL